MTNPFNPFVAQRKEHKLMLLSMIKENGNMEQGQLVALFSLKTGLKRATVREYWEELDDAGVLEDGKFITRHRVDERSLEALESINRKFNRDVSDSKKHTDDSEQRQAENP